MSFYERIRVFTWVILNVVVTSLIVFYGSFVRVVNGAVCHLDFDHKTAIVTYDPDKTQAEVSTEATTNVGYPSTVKTEEPQAHD